MSLKSLVKKLEQEIKPLEPELTPANWTNEEIDQAIDLLINGMPWPEELQRKREATYWQPCSLSTEELHKRIDELLIMSGRQPIYSKQNMPLAGL